MGVYEKREQKRSYSSEGNSNGLILVVSLLAATFISSSAISFILFLAFAFLPCQPLLPSLSRLASVPEPYLEISSIFSTGTYNLSFPLYISLRQSLSKSLDLIVSKPSYLPIPCSTWTSRSPVVYEVISRKKFSAFFDFTVGLPNLTPNKSSSETKRVLFILNPFSKG